MKTLILFLLSISLLSCSKNNLSINIMTSKNPIAKPTQTYLALGDSYTIGEAVPANASFPFQLQTALNLAAKPTAIPQIIAKTGWTTGELKAATQEKNIKQSFDLVTLLIGVNNQYRGLSIDAYRLEFKELLQMAIAFAGGDVKRVYVLSIPDWGVTPFAQGRDRAEIAMQIDAFNAVKKEETLKAGMVYIDITPDSRLAATDLSLLATDGLHPSGKMYAEWVKQLLPVIN